MESGIVGKTEPQMSGGSGSGGEIGKVVILLGRVSLTCGTDPCDKIEPQPWDRLPFGVDVQPALSVRAEHSGPLFSWQQNRNLEKQPVCRCWDLDNLANSKNGFIINILYY